MKNERLTNTGGMKVLLLHEGVHPLKSRVGRDALALSPC